MRCLRLFKDTVLQVVNYFSDAIDCIHSTFSLQIAAYVLRNIAASQNLLAYFDMFGPASYRVATAIKKREERKTVLIFLF